MITILYEDNHLIAVDKPSGLLTQPSGTDDDCLESRVKNWIKERDHKSGNVFLEAVHRLDRAASGIVMFAKTSKALSRLMKSVRERRIDKRYLACVEGRMETGEGSLEHYLVHGDRKAFVARKGDTRAKVATLHYKVAKLRGDITFVEIQLETGRYHQIRAQLSHIGHPICGDAKYGAKRAFSEAGIALCHVQLVVPHPITGEDLVVRRETPWS